MELNINIILISIVISLVIGIVALILHLNLKKRHYDIQSNKAILESIRATLEKQIYGINDRLIQTEERWRDVNHLLIREEYKYNDTPISNSRITYYSDFLKENGLEQNDLLIDKKLIFVITPFNERFYRDYKVIQETCQSLGFTCLRGDESYFKGDIFPEVLKLITKANLIIANINGRNPNVMYELGIAHALDKPVLLFSSTPENLPIDIKSKRFLMYTNYEDLKVQIRNQLINLT